MGQENSLWFATGGNITFGSNKGGYVFENRIGIVVLLVAGIVTAGCRQSSPDTRWGSKVVEFRPDWKPEEKKAPYSAVYVLWAWEPIRRPTTGPASRSAKLLPGQPWERPHEVQQTYVEHGGSIGFRKEHGQLIGIIGPTTMPLTQAHYTWRMLPGDPNNEAVDRANAVTVIVRTVLTATLVVVFVAVVAWAVHEDRHHLLDDDCGCD